MGAVLTSDEELRHLEAAVAVGDGSLRAFDRALEGIRVTVRGALPIRPADPFLLRDGATILHDCELRPEECHRLKWENIRDGAVEIFKGKRKASRRRVPASARALAVLAMRKATPASEGSSLPRRERSYRVFNPEEVTPGRAGGARRFSIRDLRPSAHPPDALGEGNGPVLT